MTVRVHTGVLWVIAAVGAMTTGVVAAAETPAALLRRYCSDCHFAGAHEGGLALDELLQRAGGGPGSRPRGAAGRPDHAAWIAVWKNLRAGTMPPPDETQPSTAERASLGRWLERDVFGLDPARPDPGRVTVRRLNRAEYAHTIEALTGLRYEAQATFPADDTGHGFDTVGDVLTISPMLLEKYLDAAAEIAGRVVDAMPKPGAAATPAFAAGGPPEDAAQRDAWLSTTLRRFADRAFRRPVDDATAAAIARVAAASAPDSDDRLRRQLTAGFTAILAAPRFLFRVEQPAQKSGKRTAATDGTPPSAVPLDDWSLASRLSYFLWSTMPDDELFRLAAAGKLRESLDAQVERMLADPRAATGLRNFVGQWLRTRDVEALPFDAARILGMKDRKEAEKIFSRAVRRAMREQTELHVLRLVRENLPLTDLLVATETFLNADLARYYGIADVKGNDLQLVTVPADSHRGGLFTQGSFLLVTSNPSRTSPVKRGLFILENILGTPALPAPADVPPLEDAAKAAGGKASMRELMERHRRDPLCASCHSRMDPLGLALEHYNAAGQWRDKDGAATIDTAGRLATGETFTDAADLARLIAGPRRTDYHRCLTEKLLTYALGRGVEYFDAPAVDTIVAALDRDGRARTLFRGVVTSVPFTMMRPDEQAETR
jgi:mono/diheme cytochrome c family protein